MMWIVGLDCGPTSIEGIIYHCRVGSESSENAKLRLWTHLGGVRPGRKPEDIWVYPDGT